MTTVYGLNLEVEAEKAEVDRGTTPLMAPERLVPSKLGLEKDMPIMEADIYTMAMVIYQVRTTKRSTLAHINSSV